MGIGRGDSSRRVVGLKPVRVDEFERRLVMIKELMNGRQVEWNGKELRLEWVREEVPDIPMHVAGYGPRALGVAGRVGDGVIIQLADPQIIQWIMETARKAAEEAGRDPAALKCIVCAPSHVTDDLADAREQVRWFPAMVSNHVMDLIERYGEGSDEIPSALTDFVKARKFYDYSEHSRVGAKHGEFVTDEICDRFCVLGNAEQITEKLRELESIGVDQFNIYLMTKGQDETLAAYGEEIIPKFARRRGLAVTRRHRRAAPSSQRAPPRPALRAARRRALEPCARLGGVLVVPFRVELEVRSSGRALPRSRSGRPGRGASSRRSRADLPRSRR